MNCDFCLGTGQLTLLVNFLFQREREEVMGVREELKGEREREFLFLN